MISGLSFEKAEKKTTCVFLKASTHLQDINVWYYPLLMEKVMANIQ